MFGELDFPNSAQSLQPPIVYAGQKVSWEYKLITRDRTTGKVPDEAERNEVGEAGWELAGVLAGTSVAHFCFKRLAR